MKIDYTQQINKCTCYVEKEMKLAQKEYKTMYYWVGKVINEELCNWLMFYYATKYNMHKPKSLQKDESHKILRDSEIQTDPLIPIRRPDLMLIKKKKEFAI